MQKQGFTLLELLIVMVIVGVLITIGLPKYQRALERGRSIEGLTNARMAADYAGAQYVLNGTYPTGTAWQNAIKQRILKKNYFKLPTITVDSSNHTRATISATRTAGKGWNYSIQITVTNGEITNISCTPSDICQELNLDSL